MGTPISPEAALREYVLEGRKPFDAALESVGIDIQVLERAYGLTRPRLSELTRQRSLDSWFHEQHGTKVPLLSAAMEDTYSQVSFVCAWHMTLRGNMWAERDLEQPFMSMYDAGFGGEVKGTSRRCVLYLYLTRRGEWIIWANHPRSRFSIADDAPTAVRNVIGLVPDERKLQRIDGERTESRSVALDIARGLGQLLALSIDARRKTLVNHETALADIQALLGRVSSTASTE